MGEGFDDGVNSEVLHGFWSVREAGKITGSRGDAFGVREVIVASFERRGE